MLASKCNTLSRHNYKILEVSRDAVHIVINQYLFKIYFQILQNYHQPPQVVDMTDSHHPVPMTTNVVTKVTNDVRKWTPDDVKNWLNKNNLPVYV